ncbi:DUF6766 family protein [Flavobacterium sp.]|uniref:DUF6766 family protein n=1 Tax=Flavobacterium sp. TaxID=239 RepID=UPI002BCDDB90|nr:DUF6766 family protein [Flavobacterium sp.]HSD07424.1 DUF6766 family protein [Flavobacterium sp.]
MKKLIKDNSLSLAFLLLFIISIALQIIFGLKEYNKFLIENDAPAVDIVSYLQSGHFIESTFENWESEFLQMLLFVVFTIFLQQRGSSESKDFSKEEDVDQEPSPDRKDAPWPVRKGGFVLAIYKHSLSIALFLLFLLSFVLHFYGSLKDENKSHILKNESLETAANYIADSRFWFESFQNWQSEFLSVYAIVVLSIYLRQIGSSQSKPVDAPNSETGE